jgi:hypothetical protein
MKRVSCRPPVSSRYAFRYRRRSETAAGAKQIVVQKLRAGLKKLPVQGREKLMFVAAARYFSAID